MKIFFATRARGFFKHLFSCKEIEADIVYNKSEIYEINNWFHAFASKCVRSELGDWLGIVQTIKCRETGCDIHGSFNRFLDSDKPYFVYVENPTALYHYCLGRNKTLLGRKAVTRNLANHNLKALVFMSKACANTFETVCGNISPECIKSQIYPLIPRNKYVSEEQIRAKRDRQVVKMLYIAQGVRFLSKGAQEVLEAYKRLEGEGVPCTLTMVTNISQIGPILLNEIRQINGVTLHDFKFTYDEMEQLYADHDILLQPTSDDSSPLTILEALHAGLAIVASRLYAIPEVVNDGVNGFLTNPAYWFFDRNNIPNSDVWNHREDTIYSGKRSEDVTKEVHTCIKRLIKDRNLLENMALASYRMSQQPPFSHDYIVGQWNSLLETIK